jgi:hypothetical protein
MIKIIPLFVFWFASLDAVLAASFELPDAKVTVRVIDQDSKEVAGAFVGIAGTVTGSVGSFKKETSDTHGVCQAQFKSKGEISVTAEKHGWYRSEYWKAYSYLAEPHAFEKAIAAGRWTPWNPVVEVLLKRVINPIPMYSRAIETTVPVDSAEVGFDLESSDWVAPYGAGTASDVVFRVDRIVQSDRDYSATLAVSFSNKGDGIRAFQAAEHEGSVLKSPHIAPEDGYLSAKVWRQSRNPGRRGGSDNFVEDERKDQNYFFRVRTVLGEAGQTKSALYGKIYSDIRLYVGTKVPKAGIGFTYYLNPTPNDRNVEFDPKRNLFTNLKDEERVTAP